jgi:hypothetical protein
MWMHLATASKNFSNENNVHNRQQQQNDRDRQQELDEHVDFIEVINFKKENENKLDTLLGKIKKFTKKKNQKAVVPAIEPLKGEQNQKVQATKWLNWLNNHMAEQQRKYTLFTRFKNRINFKKRKDVWEEMEIKIKEKEKKFDTLLSKIKENREKFDTLLCKIEENRKKLNDLL